MNNLKVNFNFDRNVEGPHDVNSLHLDLCTKFSLHLHVNQLEKRKRFQNKNFDKQKIRKQKELDCTDMYSNEKWKEPKKNKTI